MDLGGKDVGCFFCLILREAEADVALTSAYVFAIVTTNATEDEYGTYLPKVCDRHEHLLTRVAPKHLVDRIGGDEHTAAALEQMMAQAYASANLSEREVEIRPDAEDTDRSRIVVAVPRPRSMRR